MTQTRELTGKVALVTGGSRGIGAAIARRLASQGAAVALTYVNSADKADRMWAVNVRAAFVAAQAAAKRMPEGGRIIMIGSSLAERVPAPGVTLYSMTKAALNGLTRGLARDLGKRGINVTTVQAGLIDTDMNPADGPAAEFFATFPALGRYGEADDVAAAVAYLAGDGGRYVTGTTLTVDGGFAG